MSMSVYVECSNGLYYKNPVYGDLDNWFLCFDDDDPDEIVVRLDPGETMEQARVRAARLLHEEGFDAVLGGSRYRKPGHRSFTHGMKPAYSAWVRFNTAPPPPPGRHDGLKVPGLGVVQRYPHKRSD